MPQDHTDEKTALVRELADAIIREQVITWANVDPDLCRHMATLGRNVLMEVIVYKTDCRRNIIWNKVNDITFKKINYVVTNINFLHNHPEHL